MKVSGFSFSSTVWGTDSEGSTRLRRKMLPILRGHSLWTENHSWYHGSQTTASGGKSVGTVFVGTLISRLLFEGSRPINTNIWSTSSPWVSAMNDETFFDWR